MLSTKGKIVLEYCNISKTPERGAVVFQLNLKYLHVKITNLLRVVV